MKLLLGLLVSLAITSAFALPARSPKDEVDIVRVPQGQQRSPDRENDSNNDDTDVDPDYKNFNGFVDTGAGYPFLAPLPRPFSFNLGFFDSFDDIFRGLRNRFWTAATDSDDSSEEGSFNLGSNPINDTTSVVKVVDGHKVEINETVIGNGNGHGALFKFRIINIRPLESGEEVSEGTQTSAPAIADKTANRDRDIEGNSDEVKETKSSDENEINANVDDPEITTEAITTDMLDTGLPSLDNNTIVTESPVKHDELQEDTLSPTEGLDDTEDVAALVEDTPNLADNTMKSEQLSTLADSENVNEEDIKSSSLETAVTTSTDSSEEDKTDGSNDANDEINESIVVNQDAEDAVEELEELLEKRQEIQEIIAEKQMEALADSVGEKLSMADTDEERFADEVEKMLSTDNADDESENDETIEEATQNPFNQQKHSLREDVSSSDDEDENEEKGDENENEKSDNTKNEGLESEWGNINIVSLDDKNILTNEIDAYESVPVDLSNDIAINDMLADQGVPINEHAELIDVEKLSSGPEESSRIEILADIK